MSKQHRGIYKRIIKTYSIENINDRRDLVRHINSTQDLAALLSSIEGWLQNIVAAAIERERPTIEADLQRQRRIVTDFAGLTTRRTKKLNAERVRRDPAGTARLLTIHTFDKWRAVTLGGRNRLPAGCDDRERDAHEALFTLVALRHRIKAGDAENVAVLAYMLGRIVGRVEVRPFEDYVRKERYREDRMAERAAEMGAARRDRNTAIRKVREEHPDWSASRIQKHPPLLRRFPDVGRLSERRVRAILTCA